MIRNQGVMIFLLAQKLEQDKINDKIIEEVGSSAIDVIEGEG